MPIDYKPLPETWFKNFVLLNANMIILIQIRCWVESALWKNLLFEAGGADEDFGN